MLNNDSDYYDLQENEIENDKKAIDEEIYLSANDYFNSINNKNSLPGRQKILKILRKVDNDQDINENYDYQDEQYLHDLQDNDDFYDDHDNYLEDKLNDNQEEDYNEEDCYDDEQNDNKISIKFTKSNSKIITNVYKNSY